MTRGLRYGEYLLGMAGMALLRLRQADNASSADECLAEIRALLALIAQDPYTRELRGPRLNVLDGYARWAQVYDRPGNPLVACEDPIARELLDIVPGDPVLDAACGTGRHLAFLASRGRRAIGVDLSPDMLEKARAKLANPDLRLGDLNHLPVEDGEAAAVICSLSLEHVADLAPVYAEFARVVRPGGTLLISSLHPVMTLVGWGAWFVDSAGRGDVVTYRHDVSEHTHAATVAGLRLKRVREPLITVEMARGFAAKEVPASGELALEGLPFLLVCQFERPEAL